MNNETEAYLWMRRDAAAKLAEELEKFGKAVRRIRTRRFLFIIDAKVPSAF
jgi:hypothetical protein